MNRTAPDSRMRASVSAVAAALAGLLLTSAAAPVAASPIVTFDFEASVFFAGEPWASSGSGNDVVGDALPTSVDLGSFDSLFGGLLAAGAGATQLQYTITSVNRVPAPATALLLVVGLLGLCRAGARAEAA